MDRRLPVVVLVSAVLAVAGCGDPNAISDAAQQAAPDSTLASVADTTAAVEDTAPATFETIARADDEPAANTDVVAPTEPRGGVAIIDPLPPQADATVDAAAAETAVRYAYQHWILVDLDKDLRARLVENCEINVDIIDSGMQAARGIVEFARVVVDEIRFTASDRAEVTFRLQWRDSPSPYFPDALSGTAVFQNGTWRISGQTLCLLAFGAGQDCAGAGAENPIPPAVLQLLTVPIGYSWAGDPATPNTISVPGFGEWTGSGTASLTIATEALAGMSKLTASEIDLVLASGRFGAGAGAPYVVANQRARLADVDGVTDLVYLRADDVVVHIHATNLTGQQITELASAIVG